MGCTTPSLRWPRAVAALWLATLSASVLAVPVLMASFAHRHAVRAWLQPLALGQAWISIAACVALLLLSQPKHAQSQAAWARGALLMYVLAGLLTAVVLQYGVLPTWWLPAPPWSHTLQVLALMALHWGCAVCTWRSLQRSPR